MNSARALLFVTPRDCQKFCAGGHDDEKERILTWLSKRTTGPASCRSLSIGGFRQGYGLHRLIRSLGHECVVVAPSLIPRKPGNRVKTNRRDALALARLLRAGELTAVWVPDEGHEGMPDLVRARTAAVETLRVHRQQISALMLEHSRIYPRKKGWTMRYLRWLQEEQFDHPARQIALQEIVEAVRVSKERVERLEKVIEELFLNWSLAPVVRALQTLRGVDMIFAVTFATEVGDVGRFESPAN